MPAMAASSRSPCLFGPWSPPSSRRERDIQIKIPDIFLLMYPNRGVYSLVIEGGVLVSSQKTVPKELLPPRHAPALCTRRVDDETRENPYLSSYHLSDRPPSAGRPWPAAGPDRCWRTSHAGLTASRPRPLDTAGACGGGRVWLRPARAAPDKRGALPARRHLRCR